MYEPTYIEYIVYIVYIGLVHVLQYLLVQYMYDLASTCSPASESPAPSAIRSASPTYAEMVSSK